MWIKVIKEKKNVMVKSEKIERLILQKKKIKPSG